MKSICYLNRTRSNDHTIETRRNVCCACIDSDHLDCNEGALNIQAYKIQLEEEDERKKKLIAVCLIAQKEIKLLEKELNRN